MKKPVESPLSMTLRKRIASLEHRKYRQRHGIFLVEGARSVQAAATASAEIQHLFLTANAWSKSRQIRKECRDDVIHLLSESDMSQISDVQMAQGIVAIVRLPGNRTDAPMGSGDVLVLDGLQDPGNTGTLIRTAAWFGIPHVLSGPGTADFFAPKVVRASMGGIWDVSLERTDDLPGWLQRWTDAGRACYAADLTGIDFREWKPVHPSALVIGSEAHGLSPDVSARVGTRIHISGSSRRTATESLNAAVAGGIVMEAWSHTG